MHAQMTDRPADRQTKIQSQYLVTQMCNMMWMVFYQFCNLSVLCCNNGCSPLRSPVWMGRTPKATMGRLCLWAIQYMSIVAFFRNLRAAKQSKVVDGGWNNFKTCFSQFLKIMHCMLHCVWFRGKRLWCWRALRLESEMGSINTCWKHLSHSSRGLLIRRVWGEIIFQNFVGWSRCLLQYTTSCQFEKKKKKRNNIFKTEDVTFMNMPKNDLSIAQPLSIKLSLESVCLLL